MTTAAIEAYALSFSDGTFGTATDLKQAQQSRAFADDKETDPAHLTDIVRVRLEVIEVVERFRGETVPPSSCACPHCGKEATP